MTMHPPAIYTVIGSTPAGNTKATLTITVALSGSDLQFNQSAVGPPTASQQGWATDGTYNYTFDTRAIYKRSNNSTWSMVTSNLSPFNGLTEGIDHSVTENI
ncbi:MAG: hypothetical protein WAL56_13790, partial [Candidatus Sulfotelmatobacter sp.]